MAHWEDDLSTQGTTGMAQRDILLSEWRLASRALSALREPEAWFERISERVEVREDELHRRVSIQLKARQGASGSGDLLIAIQTPRKGALSDLRLVSEAGEAQLLSHEAHNRLSRLMIMFRFLAVLRRARSVVKNPTRLDARAPRVLDALLKIVDAPAESQSAPASISHLFANGLLIGFPRGRKMSDLRRDLERLYALCQVLADRYYRFVWVASTGGSVTLSYEYSQEREARSYGFRLVRKLRRWFRAPASMFFVHAPLARLTPHYELRLEAIDGYYVREQFVLRSGDDPSPQSTRGSSNVSDIPVSTQTWWSTRRGGWSSGLLFIGNGHLSDARLYAAFRLLEVPPGATGRAFAGSALGAFTLTAIVIWSMTHGAPDSLIAPELLVALVALGSAVLDNTTAKREVFNSPFLPRFALFSQTVLAICVSIWLLTRSTAETMIEPDWSVARDLGAALTIADAAIGIALAAASMILLFVLSVRSAVAANEYDRAMRDGAP
jgi:hypothetical protein